MNSQFAEQRARDALEFDPLPPSPWVTIGDDEIVIKTNYSEPLSRLLRELPSNRWQPEQRCWLLPFSSAEALRKVLPEIDRLAREAKQSADEETSRRDRERQVAARHRLQEMATAERERQVRAPRPLRSEYLYVIQGRPKYAIILEAIGDDTVGVYGTRPRHWITQIFGCDGRGRWIGAKLYGARDYSSANSIGSRGVMVTYLLDEGPIYQVCSPQSWTRADTYFCRILDGQCVRMSDDEVRACLSR